MATVTYIFTIRELRRRVQHVKLRMERPANNIATIRSVESVISSERVYEILDQLSRTETSKEINLDMGPPLLRAKPMWKRS